MKTTHIKRCKELILMYNKFKDKKRIDDLYISYIETDIQFNYTYNQMNKFVRISNNYIDIFQYDIASNKLIKL